MTFGEKILQVRKSLKWSQNDLAQKVGTSAPIIGRYERGEIKPSIEMAAKIADALEVTTDYLLGRSDKIVLDRKMLERLESIEDLPEEDKQKIYYFIDMAIRDVKAKVAYSG